MALIDSTTLLESLIKLKAQVETRPDYSDQITIAENRGAIDVLDDVLDIIEDNKQEGVGPWNLFKDRAISLLHRWDTFKNKHGEILEKDIIGYFLSELNDEITERLMSNK